MTYELAKKLKESGFPQKNGEAYLMNDKYEIVSEMGLYNPSLEELIEACGSKLNLFECEGYWAVIKTKESILQKNTEGNPYIVIETIERATGKDSLEAVAKLWIKLRKISNYN